MTLLERTSNVRLWCIIAFALLSYFPVWYFTRDVLDLFEIVNLLVVAVAFGSIVGFHPAAWNALRMPRKELTPAQILIVGIVGLALCMAFRFTAQFAWRVLDKPNWLIDHWALGWVTWAIFIFWSLCLIASSSKGGVMPPAVYKKAGFTVFAVTFGIGIVMTFWTDKLKQAWDYISQSW